MFGATASRIRRRRAGRTRRREIARSRPGRSPPAIVLAESGVSSSLLIRKLEFQAPRKSLPGALPVQKRPSSESCCGSPLHWISGWPLQATVTADLRTVQTTVVRRPGVKTEAILVVSLLSPVLPPTKFRVFPHVFPTRRRPPWSGARPQQCRCSGRRLPGHAPRPCSMCIPPEASRATAA